MNDRLRHSYLKPNCLHHLQAHPPLYLFRDNVRCRLSQVTRTAADAHPYWDTMQLCLAPVVKVKERPGVGSVPAPV